MIKADSSVRKPIISAKQKLKEILPDEAGIVDTRFDEINGDVILEATNPGRAIGKHGVVLNQIRREIGWNPVIIRSSPMESRTLKDIRNYMLEDKVAEGAKEILNKGWQKNIQRYDSRGATRKSNGSGRIPRSWKIVSSFDDKR